MQLRWYPFGRYPLQFTVSCPYQGFSRDLTLLGPSFISLGKLSKTSPPWKPSATQQPEVPATPTQWESIHGTSYNNIMGLGWPRNWNLGSEGLASEVLLVQLGQNSEPVGTLIIPAISANNQPVTQTKVGSKRFRSGVQNGIVTVISCGVAGGGKWYLPPIASELQGRRVIVPEHQNNQNRLHTNPNCNVVQDSINNTYDTIVLLKTINCTYNVNIPIKSNIKITKQILKNTSIT